MKEVADVTENEAMDEDQQDEEDSDDVIMGLFSLLPTPDTTYSRFIIFEI
jgi:hypothetical protein